MLKSLARYQYVSDNPATYLDPDGHLCARRGAGDGLPLGCGAPPVQAYNNVTMPPPAPPYVPKKKDSPKPKGPGTQMKVQERHAENDSYWDKVANNWNKTWEGVGPKWNRTWENFFDNPEGRDFLAGIAWLGNSGSGSFQYCGLVACFTYGTSGVGFGPALGAGISGQVGVGGAKLSGLGFTIGCQAAGGGGVYATYSRDWQGNSSPEVGASTGGELSCSGMIMWFW